MNKKLLFLLVLLLTAATGAWATDYTTLAVGDVIKVGDTFTPTADGAFNIDFGVDMGKTYTLMRADIDNEGNVTEKTDGAYYVFKYASIMNPNTYMHFEKAFAVTAISDGLEVTKIETGKEKGNLTYTLAVHEPAAASGYTVSLKDGVKDADKWTVKVGEGQAQALPIGGLKGDGSETVTLQYNGRLKVKGVKATSDAAPAAPASLILNPVVGQIIGSDGKNYDANATLPTGVTAVAKICYVGSETGEAAPYNHGLALALSNANGGSSCMWKTSNTDAGHTKQTSNTFTEESGLQYNDATHNSDTYPAFKAAIANNGTAAPTGCSAWFLASGYQWKMMADAAGLTNLGLTEGAYWSSSERVDSQAWAFFNGNWYNINKNTGFLVLACLAF